MSREACTIALRAAAADDEALLEQLFVEDRWNEFAGLGWPVDMVRNFLAGQFRVQQQGYGAAFPHLQQWVVLRDSDPIGTIAWSATPVEWRLVNVVLASAHRGQGIGTYLLQQCVHMAHEAHVPLTLSVRRDNPALRLYLRHGFTAVNDDGIALQMRRAAG